MMEEIISVVSGYTTVPAGEITAESSFQDDLGFASIDSIAMMHEIENTFHIRLEDWERAYELKTVSDLATLVEKLQQENTGEKETEDVSD